MRPFLSAFLTALIGIATLFSPLVCSAQEQSQVKRKIVSQVVPATQN